MKSIKSLVSNLPAIVCGVAVAHFVSCNNSSDSQQEKLRKEYEKRIVTPEEAMKIGDSVSKANHLDTGLVQK